MKAYIDASGWELVGTSDSRGTVDVERAALVDPARAADAIQSKDASALAVALVKLLDRDGLAAVLKQVVEEAVNGYGEDSISVNVEFRK